MNQSIKLYKSNDLMLMASAGLAHYIINIQYFSMDVYQQLLICFAFSAVAGLLVIDRSQLLEWPLFFIFGGIIASLLPFAKPMLSPFEFNYWLLAQPTLNTLYWYGFLVVTWALGLPIGMLVHRLFLGKNYWVQKSILH